jgi:hypothetical protein
MRVGFACDDLCVGGSWHGKGGEYVLSGSVGKWRHGLLILTLFLLLLAMLATAINMARKYYDDGDSDADLLFVEKSSILGFQGRMAYVNIDKVSRDHADDREDYERSYRAHEPFRLERVANDQQEEEDRLIRFQASSFIA